MVFYTYENFCKEINDNFLSYLSQNLNNNNYSVVISKIKEEGNTKASDMLQVIPRDNPEITVPMIKLSKAYQMFRNSSYTFEDYLKNMATSYEKSYFEDLENEVGNDINRRLFLTVINYHRNKQDLNNFPHIIKGDYAIICRSFHGEIDHDHFMNYKKFLIVNNDMVKQWNVEIPDLFQIAYENTMKLMPSKYIRINDLDFNQNSAAIFPDGILFPDVYVLSNAQNFFGVATMFYNENPLKELADLNDKNIIIIPASVHELICVLDNNPNNVKDYSLLLNDLIKDTDLDPDDFLDDHALYYDRERNIIIQMDNQEFTLGLGFDQKLSKRRKINI